MWQPIETAPKDGREWRVCVDGTVTRDGRELHQYTNGRGYKKVTMGGKSVSVHRLVAMAFIPNPSQLSEVNHKNGKKFDNRADNLEWCTRSQNMKHAYASGLHSGVALRGSDNPNWGRRGKLHSQSMAVKAIFPDGSSKVYESQGLAANDGFTPCKISECVNGRRRAHKGVIWQPLPPPPQD